MKVIQYNDRQAIYLVDSKDLIHVQNWHHNRPPCEKRVLEIQAYIEKTGIVDGIIYIYEIEENNNYNYYCYDGNHRLSALKALRQSYGTLINIYKVNDENPIKEKFIKLNLANPVPKLYFNTDDSQNIIIKNIVNDVVKTLINKYSVHLSSSPHPRKPNFNRDNIVDKLSKFLLDQEKYNITKDQLIAELDRINLDCKNGKIKIGKVSKSVLDKATKNQCYLFLINFIQEIKL